MIPFLLETVSGCTTRDHSASHIEQGGVAGVVHLGLSYPHRLSHGVPSWSPSSFVGSQFAFGIDREDLALGGEKPDLDRSKDSQDQGQNDNSPSLHLQHRLSLEEGEDKHRGVGHEVRRPVWQP